MSDIPSEQEPERRVLAYASVQTWTGDKTGMTRRVGDLMIYNEDGNPKRMERAELNREQSREFRRALIKRWPWIKDVVVVRLYSEEEIGYWRSLIRTYRS